MDERRLILKNGCEERKPVKTPLVNVNSFLYKLWWLINDETIPSIHWSQDGEKLVIDDPTKFTANVLASSDKQLFKTQNIASFIRQLNLYGFRRVKENCGKIPLIFYHEFFKKDRTDLLVEVKRRRHAPIRNKSLPPALPENTPKVSKPTVRTKQTHTLPGYNPYRSLPTTQPYKYFHNPTAIGGKNVPVPFVTPFAVNHGPTFINLGSHSTIYSKPRLQASSVSKVDDDNSTSVEKPSESKELEDLKVESETLQHPWQHAAYYNTQLQDRKTLNPYNNSMASQAFFPMQGNYQKYPPTYLHGNMFPFPQLRYRNYGDPSESMPYQSQRHHAALATNPYLPSFPPPPFLKPINLASYPKTTEDFSKLPSMKSEEPTNARPTTNTKRNETTLESFSVFSSHVPHKKVGQRIICKLTADEEKECSSDEKK